jgi:DnaJ like chaperone protein
LCFINSELFCSSKFDTLFKFILAVVGFFALGQRIGGAFLGFFIGSLIDNAQANAKAQPQGGGRSRSAEDMFTYYQQRTTQQDFLTMLIAMSAAVMRADGKVLKAELDYVKTFFKNQFGPRFDASHLQSLKRFLDSGNIPLEQICSDIRNRTQLDARIQLVHYLFGIAKADGSVSTAEIQVIQRISNLLGVPQSDFESLKNMFYRDVNSDYKVLGLEASATDEEIKKAYRQMAVRYHPDKVAQMGEEHQKGAKEKFQAVQEAYENIKKERGIK